MPLCGRCHREAPDGALFCSFCGGAIKPAAAEGEAVDPLIGQTVAGKYFIHQLLGHGGMGDVYKATHLTLDRPVVLKLLKKQFNTDPSLVQRFHREARASSRLNHPNSITIIDFGQTDDGTLFMAMEFLAGRSLERIIVDDFPLPEPRVIHIVAQVLAALGEAHALGIIHRDLKPANVMIEPRRDEPDFVKVLDFGIAKLNEPGAGGPGLTQAGIVCGTPGYMSPEQVRGEELDARSDIYAVGVILYEMLTGLLPFESETPMGLVTKHLVEDPPPLAARRPGTLVTPELEGLIMKALARDRAERFASSDEMRAALLACGTPAAGPLRPTPPPSSTMIFDPASLGARGAKPPSQPLRAVTGPSRAAPPPSRGFTEALPASPGDETAEAEAPPAPAPRQPLPRTPAPRPSPAVGKTPAPAHRPPAGKTPAPAPTARTPAPARKAGPPAPPARPTPAAKGPQRPPAPRHEMDELEEEAAAEQAAAPPRRSKVPLIAGAGAAGVLILGLVVWGLTRAPEPPPVPAPKPAPVAQTPAQVPAPAPQPPSQQTTAPQPAPDASPPPVAAPTAAPPVAAPPPVVLPPQPDRPAVAGPTPAPTPETHPTPKPVPRPVARPAAGVRGVRLVRAELNAIRTPPAASGDGVLAVVATPWAEVFIEGHDVGETPREIQLGAGTYRVKATHPALGTREQVVTIKPGKRHVWAPTFAN